MPANPNAKLHAIPEPARAPSAHKHAVADLTATGTRDATTFLRGDNTWAVPAGGGGGGTTSDWGTITSPTTTTTDFGAI